MKINIFYLFASLLLLGSCDNKSKETTTTTTQSDFISTKKYLRKNAHSPEAQKDIEALEKALEIMRKKDCSDPLSWYYQGGIHWVPDTVQGNPLCKSYQTVADLKTAWDNCTHSESGEEELHFLLWHRLYILHFERIVRKLSGYEEFALPYWGYTDTTNVELNRTMPKAYRTKGNPLFEASRFDSLNQGFPIQGKTLRSISTSKLFENTAYNTFCSNIDRAPHGAMHNYVGHGNIYGKVKYWNPIYNVSMDDGLMGEVPSAGFDPIFWAHHANIDRVWQQWTNTPNGQLVCLDSLKRHPWKYQFFDENGKEVVYTIDEVYNMIYDLMDYDYDDTPVKGKREIPDCKSTGLLQATKDNSLATRSFNIKLTDKVHTFSLSNKKIKAKVPLLSSTNKTGNRVILKVTVELSANPRGNYEVYLNLPPKEDASPESKYFCGFMTFFGANHHHRKHHQKGNSVLKTFEFDITNEVSDTQALDKQDYNLSILKFEEKPSESIIIKNIQVTTL